MSMTLTEVIQHAQERAKSDCSDCAKEHEQLANWLKELKRLREQNKLTTVFDILYSLDAKMIDYADNLKMYCEYHGNNCKKCPFYKSYITNFPNIFSRCGLYSKPRDWEALHVN